MAAWTGHSYRPDGAELSPGRGAYWTPPPRNRAEARERYFGGEPTGDPDQCESGDHPVTVGGRCKFCGEAVL